MNSEEKFMYEKQLVSEAIKSAEGEKRLIDYMTPYVNRIAYKYLERGLDQEELKAAAFSNIHHALVVYNHSLNEGKDYPFSTYFAWWARQGITARLKDI